MLNTDNWASYPFSVEGVNFVAKLDPQGSFYPQVERLPANVFAQYNAEAITKLVGNPTLMTADEIQNELDTINLGASQAILALA